MKTEFSSERRLRLAGWVFLGAVAVVVGMVTVFGYLAGVTIVQGWGDLEGPGSAVDAQEVGALALIEGVLVVLLIVLTVAFSRTRRAGRAEGNRALRDEIAARKRAEGCVSAFDLEKMSHP